MDFAISVDHPVRSPFITTSGNNFEFVPSDYIELVARLWWRHLLIAPLQPARQHWLLFNAGQAAAAAVTQGQ